jgi:hypothetical protein
MGLFLCGNQSRRSALARMPRFYFDMVMNGDTEHDEVGVTLPDANLARQQAVVAAADWRRCSPATVIRCSSDSHKG